MSHYTYANPAEVVYATFGRCSLIDVIMKCRLSSHSMPLPREVSFTKIYLIRLKPNKFIGPNSAASMNDKNTSILPSTTINHLNRSLEGPIVMYVYLHS